MAKLSHSVLRRFRFGYKDGSPEYYLTPDIKDNIVFKMSLAYRVRFTRER